MRWRNEGCRLGTEDWRLTKRAIEFGNERVPFRWNFANYTKYLTGSYTPHLECYKSGIVSGTQTINLDRETEEDRVYAGRWQNAIGEKGAWSEMVSAAIS
jgi:hypothetical protein